MLFLCILSIIHFYKQIILNNVFVKSGNNVYNLYAIAYLEK